MLEEERNKKDNNSSDDNPKKRKRVRVGDASSNTRERVPYRSSDDNRAPRTVSQRPEYRERSTSRDRGDRESRPYSAPRTGGYGDRESRPYSPPRSGSYGDRDSRQRDSSRPTFNSGQRDGGQRGEYRPRTPYSQAPRRTDGRNEYQQRGRSHGQMKPRQGGSPARYIKPVKYKENVDPETEIRLNKYLANAGVCSRREADGFITSGEVKVNGEVVTELGTKIKYGDKVQFKDKDVEIESKVYVLLNKPKNCVTTSDDPQNRVTVMDLVKNACTERIYPVGRLDRNTTGVLLLTNDGDLASKLMHPKFKKKKIYQVTLDKDVLPEHMQAIADGIELDDGEIHADSIAYNSEEKLDVVGIEIHSGRNRIVRRIFEKLGYKVVKLDRVYFSGLTKKNVPRGKWRYLTADEVNMLRMGSFE